MIDLQLIEGFEWDSGNDRKSAEKHDVSRSEAEQIFFNEPLLLLPDPGQGLTERRFHSLGITESRRLLHVSFTLRAAGKLIRIISARAMSRKERKFYETRQA